eukprot:COSAG01_NODE_1054_length_11906_cov_45.857796_1_plen_55_part_10
MHSWLQPVDLSEIQVSGSYKHSMASDRFEVSLALYRAIVPAFLCHSGTGQPGECV